MGRDDLLVVIGDVAGHGLKAAMNVSLIMGALRRMQDASPSQNPQVLNRVLSGTESFTTCQALWFGSMARWLSPTPAICRPISTARKSPCLAAYHSAFSAKSPMTSRAFSFIHGDRILMLSDGVVEARHPNGELFGFDRVRQLSQESAVNLAEAAKSFGQQDDITVLTVRREVEAAKPDAPAAVLSSAFS